MNDPHVTEYHSSKASPPGDFLQDWLDDYHVEAGELADRLGWSKRRLDALLAGSEHLTQDMAKELSAATGTTATSWVCLERGYRDWLRKRGTARHPTSAPASYRPNPSGRFHFEDEGNAETGYPLWAVYYEDELIGHAWKHRDGLWSAEMPEGTGFRWASTRAEAAELLLRMWDA